MVADHRALQALLEHHLTTGARALAVALLRIAHATCTRLAHLATRTRTQTSEIPAASDAYCMVGIPEGNESCHSANSSASGAISFVSSDTARSAGTGGGSDAAAAASALGMSGSCAPTAQLLRSGDSSEGLRSGANTIGSGASAGSGGSGSGGSPGAGASLVTTDGGGRTAGSDAASDGSNGAHPVQKAPKVSTSLLCWEGLTFAAYVFCHRHTNPQLAVALADDPAVQVTCKILAGTLSAHHAATHLSSQHCVLTMSKVQTKPATRTPPAGASSG